MELYLGETRQLFNSMDPAPFRFRDLDPLVVLRGRENTSGDTTAILTQTMHEYLRCRAHASRKELKTLFHAGRITSVIALVFLNLANDISEFVSELIPHEGLFWLITESLLIAATGAPCQQIAIFLYNWWPMYGRLRVMDMQVFCATTASASVEPAL